MSIPFKLRSGLDLLGSTLFQARIESITGLGDLPAGDGAIGYMSANGNKRLAFRDTEAGSLILVPRLDRDEAITGQFQFSPGSPQAPFTLAANAQAQKVIGFEADLLDGYHAAAAADASTIAVRDGAGRMKAAAPVADDDVANKAWVIDTVYGITARKIEARVLSKTNVDISSAPATIDGVTLSSDDRIGLVGQTDKSENGLYVFNGAASALTRATDADSDAEVFPGMVFWVSEGTQYGNTEWQLITDDPITLNTTDLDFVQSFGAGGVTAGSGMGVDGNEMFVKLGSSGDPAGSQYVAQAIVYADSTSTLNQLSLGSANQVLGMNSGGTAYEHKAIVGTANEIDVTHTAGQIQIGLVDPVGVAKGGTGLAVYAAGDLLYASGTTTLSKLAAAATGNALLSGTSPSWGKVTLTGHVSGILPLANGGTGTSTAFTAGSIVFAGASGVYAQDNANLFWDDANNRLGIGTQSATYTLDVQNSVTDANLFRAIRAGTNRGFTITTSGVANFASDGLGTNNGLQLTYTISRESGSIPSDGYTQYSLLITPTVAPTSGGTNISALGIIGSVNQTGTAAGYIRGVYVNPTLTALTSVDNYRAIEIGNNSGYGIYQSGASAKNYFAGNIGIGQTPTTEKLEVAGNILATGVAKFTGAGVSYINNGSLAIGASSAAGAERLRVSGDAGAFPTLSASYPILVNRTESSGANCGINILAGNAAASLIAFGDTDSLDVGLLRYDHSDNSMRFHTAGAERARFNSTGELLIGTTTDNGAYLLQVAGAVRFAGQCVITTGGADITGNVTVQGLTASQYVKTDASKNLVSQSGIPTTDLTGTLLDATVAESNVTQHEAALSIDWSQLDNVPSTFAPSAHTLDSHSNVTITAIASGEVLKWSGSAWINNTLAEADIASAATLASHTGNTSNPHSVTKAQVGLGSVENTALSTWAGTSNITTVGESAVTAHEDALSIAASQITAGTFDPGNYTIDGDLDITGTLDAVTLTQNAKAVPVCYNATVGNGVDTSFAITHNLGTEKIVFVGYKDTVNDQNGGIGWAVDSANQITIGFIDIPATDQMEIYIIAIL